VIAMENQRSSRGEPHSLLFDNQSGIPWRFVCFQQQQTGLPDGCVSLAWFSKTVVPDTEVLFNWNSDYSFICSETNLYPGERFSVLENRPIDGLTANNQIDFKMVEPPHLCGFADQTNGPVGALTINAVGLIPSGFSVGIGMGGAGIFAARALPNVKLSFVPKPAYYIAFGMEVQEGEVLDVHTLTGVRQVEFPPNVYAMTATLRSGCDWELSTGVSKDAAAMLNK